ncbi:MAG: MarR family transcriptional regulator [Pseudomonadota bacterium]
MTEIIVTNDKLRPAIQKFVLHWGDMGGQWGVNRSVAQIHALLLVSDRPLHAEEIAETLNLARSNVSNSLKELASWNLVMRTPVLGDRRDHFEAEKDVWEMSTRIAAMRKSREIDNAASILAQVLAEAKDDPGVSREAVRQLREMDGFLSTVTGWFDQMAKLPREKVMPLIKMGTKLVDLIIPLVRKDTKT